MDWKQFEDYISNKMKKDHIAGLAVAISQHGELLYQKGFGYRDINDQQAVTPETIFGTASITKSFTAASIIMLQQKEKLSVDDPVSKYIPELTISGVNVDSIKIHHLLSHTSGLPPITRNEQLTNLQAHLTYLRNTSIQLLGEPGTYFSYSNDAFLLLGIIIERVSGITYREFITKHFLEHYQMNRTTFYLDNLAVFDNVSTPYTYSKKQSQFDVEPWPTLGNYAVGGGIRSTVLDLLKYGEHYFGVNKGEYNQMWQPHIYVKPREDYGYALAVTENYNGVTLVRHSGGQHGVSSYFGFIPEKHIVISVLTNVTGVPVNDVWLAAVNTALGLPVDQQIDVGESSSLSAQEGIRFTGKYTSAEGDTFEVKLSHNKVVAVVEGTEYDLEQLDQQTLIVKIENFTLPFLMDDNNLAWAVRFGMRVLRKIRD
ncbi:serine hydrolase domain-containing protein [Radiobacillus sp. PE A8.2]|uniref:serine hydrolase domain-containing protein n=1 Tax=Radiobacillus sp. PE A8.2 TaxID=3380349 RepID=UPI0038909D3D